MKKITLVFLLLSFFSFTGVFSQVDQYYAVNGLATSGNGRAPQGSRNIARSVWLITAAEMATGGFVNGDVLTGLGFTFQIAQNTATTGTFVAYLENTADATNLKSTTWATAITGMTTVSNGSITLPNTPGEFNYNFTGGSSFTYTGGAIYVAYDYQNLGTVSTVANIAYCNNTLTGGIKTGLSAAGVTTPPTTITASNFRPATRLGRSVACARPYNLYSNVTTNTTTSANLSFNIGSSANVEIEYGAYGFTQGAGTAVTGITTNPYNLTSLSPNTVYDFYIRTNCGGSINSAWNGPYAFNTLFNPVTPPYTTSFESPNLNFVGWSTPNLIPATGDWSIGNFGAGALVQNGTSSVVSITPTTAAANNWMFSRGMNLTTGSTITVDFYISNYTATPATTAGNYDLTIGTSPTAAAQTTVVGTESAITSAVFALKSYSYVVPSSGIYYFGMRNFSPVTATGTHALIVDSFSVTETLSTDEFLASNWSVYPNPTKDLVTISATTYTISSIEMTDLNGRIIKSNTLNNVSETQLNIADLSQGVYLLKITSDKGITTKKLVVE